MRALWFTLAIVLVDQATKILVKTTMIRGQSIPVIGDLFKWTFTENPGMAFGLTLGDGDLGKLVLTVFSVVATVMIFLYLRHVRKAPWGYRLSLALILGGALGNVIDRVFYGAIWGECFPTAGNSRLLYGCVVDFVHLDVWSGYVGDRYVALFPIGNIADLAIIAGVVGVLLSQKSFQRYIEAQHATLAPGLPPEPIGPPSEEVPPAA